MSLARQATFIWVITEDPSELRRLRCIMVAGGHMLVVGNILQDGQDNMYS
jgi:hypothetical protein